MANLSIEPLVTPDLFDTYQPATRATVFFVGVFDRSVQDANAVPLCIDLAVPDHDLKNWLFKMPTTEFLKLYETQHVESAQPDLAVPTLKPGVAVGSNQKSGT